MTVPSVVFIVPYRNRGNHLNLFCRQMTYVLEDTSEQSHQILIVEQGDERPFNRGAMKNIGFLAIREKYPDDYKNITLVFNDIDSMPFFKNVLPYKTGHGTVKHFYGFDFALGGIVSITARDFELIGGFPNFWAWGFEDNELQNRVQKHGLKIDRSVFYPILDENIIHLQHGSTRGVNIQEKKRFVNHTIEGFSQIHDLDYTVENRSNNQERFKTVHVNQFKTHFFPSTENVVHELSKGTPFKHVKVKMAMKF